MSLFGAKPAAPSLFGAAPAANNTSNLFGNTASQQQNQQNQQQPMGGLFQNSTQNQPAQSSLFGAQPNSNPLAGSLSAGLTGINTGALDAQAQREFAQSRLQSIGVQNMPREKSISDQISTLLAKWDPNSSETLMQKYLYNAVNPAYAPYYHPGPGESEREWEAALANKPKGDADTAYVPVQVRGFKALGERLELQAKVLQSLRTSLHEMNNSLAAIISKHQQDISVRIEGSKRQHAAIATRTLRLAVKCQVLRNRGYALDSTEESLRRNILDLQSKVTDPSFSAREEEIWARMVALRERARWLEEEGKRVGAAVEAQKQEGGSGAVPDSVLQSAGRILKDYDGQLIHLAKEMEEIKKEYEDWEKERRG